MDTCHVCNKELEEETPMCEECQEKEIEEQVEQYNAMMNEMGEAYEEVEARKKEYDLVLDLINDDRLVSNKYEFDRMLPELHMARDAYIRCVIRNFSTSELPEDLKKLAEANPGKYDKRTSVWGVSVTGW